MSEAIVASIPILASRIDGNVGILGEGDPGYFAVGDTKHLARLLTRAETSTKYSTELRDWGETVVSLFDPRRDEQAWLGLISESFLIK